MKYVLLALYLLDAGLHMYACTPPEKHSLRRVSKCLLMPLLVCCYCLAAQQPSAIVILALVFGFFGDVFLIVPEKSWLFVSGLIAFAVGHACYIAALLQRVHTLPAPWVMVVATAVLILGMIGMMKRLWPRLPKNMFLPCLAYMGIISAMSLCALIYALQANTPGGWFAFAGSLLFIISDSVLSYVTFVRRIPYRYAVVMSTYILAQTLLMVSFLY